MIISCYKMHVVHTVLCVAVKFDINKKFAGNLFEELTL